MQNNLLLVDGSSFLFRAYFGITLDMTNSKGMSTKAIYGFFSMFDKIIADFKPKHIAVCFDLKSKTFRNEIYKDYKANRNVMPEDLAEQIPYIKKILDLKGIKRFEVEKFEADDILGTLSYKFKDAKPLIFTGDKDLLQLVDENINVIINKKGMSEYERYDINLMNEKYGFYGDAFVDYKALKGDTSDNIPGLPGVGEKTAINLIKEFKSVENLKKDIENVKNERIKNIIKNNIEILDISKKLSIIKKDVPLQIKIDELLIKKSDDKELLNLFKSLELNKFIKKLNDANKKNEANNYENNSNLIEEKSDEQNVVQSSEQNVAQSSEQNEIEFKDSDLIIEENNEIVGLYLKDYFLDELKKSKSFLSDKKYFDLNLGAYLLNSSKSKYSLNDLLEMYEIKPSNDIKKLLLALKEKITNDLKERNLYDIYTNLELDVLSVIIFYEIYGIKVSEDILKEQGDYFKNKINKLEKDICKSAGENFNINSPKQLSNILFNKLNLDSVKKTKTGLSTNNEVLTYLIDEHSIIKLILEYRKLSKLKSTYIDGFLPLIEKDSKIHASFTQTKTVTGRISSLKPNMQNLPSKDEVGREIRKAFIPEKGNVLISADYSQIELRVLAHLSKDELLIKSFKDGHDIHSETARRFFADFGNNKETDIYLRRKAKIVNFGVIYGISAFSLAKDIGESVFNAKKYIDEYFSLYKGVREYFDKAILNAKTYGYSKTILGRRRYIKELKSKNKVIQKLGERYAMNSPIQGSAADLIKIAMVNINKKLVKLGLNEDIKQILQIHDEIILEAKENLVKEAKEILKEEMLNVYKLLVPLEVNIKEGLNLYDLK